MSDINQPIGIFDSGVGGLSVMQEVAAILPFENILYYSDNAHAPYGHQPDSVIIRYSEQITDFMIAKACKVIVVACNTATAAAIGHLREKYSCPFVGIEPAIKPAALNSQTKKVGVLATRATLHGGHFINTSEKYANGVSVTVHEGQGLVEIVENGLCGTNRSIDLLKKYIMPMVDENIDHLVLGCTHYPFLIQDIKTFLPAHIKIINPAPAVAAQVKRILTGNNLLNTGSPPPEYNFFSSGKSDLLQKLAGDFAVSASKKFYRL